MLGPPRSPGSAPSSRSAGTVPDVTRTCAKPGCDRAAVATLAYAYAEGVVWLEDLAPEAHPMVHDMCRMHADTVRVPLGWELRDVRDQGHDGPVRLDLIGA
jgi:hypothetical protein